LKPIYISNATAISPQRQDSDLLFDTLVQEENNRLIAIEPDYSAIIPPMQLRRMSKVLKMGVYCGMQCLQDAAITKPDGIITGTAKGSMIDTEKFVKELKTYHEAALNPTPFILSTYNAINGAIALQTQATGYNQTYVHRGSSFENALYDAQLLLQENDDIKHYLVGAFEASTDEYYKVKAKAGYWKTQRNTQLFLYQDHNTPGTALGEGAAFFLASNHKTALHTLCLHHVSSYTSIQPSDIVEILNNVLQKAGWQLSDMDTLILGNNGDVHDEIYYNELQQATGGHLPSIAFKHLCGEYETAGSFALWMLQQMASLKPMAQNIWNKASDNADYQPKKVLYYNHYRATNHNFMLIELL
jgi:3-oxoacyl-[acyl-carrier-protein] synthase II